MKYAAWEAPIWRDFFTRGDAIFTKVVSGEISVAQGNKLTIESTGMAQSALARGNANAVAAAEAQRQRTSESLRSGLNTRSTRRFSAPVTPIRANIVGPSDSATRIGLIAAAVCSDSGSLRM
jgi:hypothetical protein